MRTNINSSTNVVTALNQFMVKVFSWMGFGLLTTAVISYLIISNPQVMLQLLNSGIILPLIIAEFIVVIALSKRIAKMKAGTATLLFFVYSALNGITLTPLLFSYTMSSVANVFISCSAMFGFTAFWGYTTKTDLSKYGKILFMGLIGLIISMVLNFFIGSSGLDYIVSIAGIVLFTALTAFDVQKIKTMFFGIAEHDEEMTHKAAIYGALKLYLDFINMFIFLLRLFGRRN